MSHRWSCPDEWEARREARLDAEYGGWNRHRYQDECPEANEAYEREFRREQYRQEEEAEERRREAHAAERRREREAEEWREYEHEQACRAEEEHYLAECESAMLDEMMMEEGRVNVDAELD